jgi:hypothetical protein
MQAKVTAAVSAATSGQASSTNLDAPEWAIPVISVGVLCLVSLFGLACYYHRAWKKRGELLLNSRGRTNSDEEVRIVNTEPEELSSTFPAYRGTGFAMQRDGRVPQSEAQFEAEEQDTLVAV